jgi:oxalate decarboxylase
MFGSDGRYRSETLEKGRRRLHPPGIRTLAREVGDTPCRILNGFNNGVYETIDLSQWIAGNPADVLATNFGKPEAPFKKFPRNDVFISLKDGP